MEPSTLDTPANRSALPDADTSRWVSVEEVAAAISFLVSEPAGALRDATLPLYGRARAGVGALQSRHGDRPRGGRGLLGDVRQLRHRTVADLLGVDPERGLVVV